MKKPLFKTFALLTAALVVSLTTQFTMKVVAELAISNPSVETVETEVPASLAIFVNVILHLHFFFFKNYSTAFFLFQAKSRDLRKFFVNFPIAITFIE